MSQQHQQRLILSHSFPRSPEYLFLLLVILAFQYCFVGDKGTIQLLAVVGVDAGIYKKLQTCAL